MVKRPMKLLLYGARPYFLRSGIWRSAVRSFRSDVRSVCASSNLPRYIQLPPCSGQGRQALPRHQAPLPHDRLHLGAQDLDPPLRDCPECIWLF